MRVHLPSLLYPLISEYERSMINKQFFIMAILVWPIILLANFVRAEPMEPRFIFFANEIQNTTPYLQPRLENGAESFVYVVSVPFQGDLRIYLCRAEGSSAPDKLWKYYLFDTLDSDHKNRFGMSAFGGGGEIPYAVFKDGSRFDAYLPPDAKPIGSEEWRYHMRWERVYGNYYAVTIYRGITITRNGLFTEKGGRDLFSALGESSATQPFPWHEGSFATDLGQTIQIYYGFPKRSERDFLSLVEVKEDQLPENFPKELVLWLK